MEVYKHQVFPFVWGFLWRNPGCLSSSCHGRLCVLQCSPGWPRTHKCLPLLLCWCRIRGVHHGEVLLGSLLSFIKHLVRCDLSSPSSSLPSPPHLSVFLKTNFCSPDISGYVVFHWSRVDLPGTTLPEKTVCPLMAANKLPVALQLGAELGAQLPSPCGSYSALLAQALYNWGLIMCSCPAASRMSFSLVVIHLLWLSRLPASIPLLSRVEGSVVHVLLLDF